MVANFFNTYSTTDDNKVARNSCAWCK